MRLNEIEQNWNEFPSFEYMKDRIESETDYDPEDEYWDWRGAMERIWNSGGIVSRVIFLDDISELNAKSFGFGSWTTMDIKDEMGEEWVHHLRAGAIRDGKSNNCRAFILKTKVPPHCAKWCGIGTEYYGGLADYWYEYEVSLDYSKVGAIDIFEQTDSAPGSGYSFMHIGKIVGGRFISSGEKAA